MALVRQLLQRTISYLVQLGQGKRTFPRSLAIFLLHELHILSSMNH